MRVFNYPAQRAAVLKHFGRTEQIPGPVIQSVEKIIRQVKGEGDPALLSLTEKFDGVKLTARQLRVPRAALKRAGQKLALELKQALEEAASRIEKFHQRQLPRSFIIKEKSGVQLSQRFVPLSRVGIYVPGGTAPYPSTVLMCALPARVAGVKEVVMCSPPPISPVILAAASLCGVSEVYQVGGAQAVAAMAMGTKSIMRVDKIVGPGNIYVATAKRLLYGRVAIDMVAGPSEVMIIADNTAPVPYVAADLLAQAEHDPQARVVAVVSKDFPVVELKRELQRQLTRSPRQSFMKKSLGDFGMVIKVARMEQAIELANAFAPEHLQIMTRGPRRLAAGITNAAAVFLGRFTPVPLGDYILGPNHTLPTAGTARFCSALNTLDFFKVVNEMEVTRKAFRRLAEPAVKLASAEELWAHAEALKIRRFS